MIKHTVFSQIMQLLYRYDFKKCVDRYHGDRYTKKMNCWQQFLVMLFAQIRGVKSLRDIQTSLESQAHKWYHLGLTSVARSTLSDANSTRNADIFRDIFYKFLEHCQLLAPRHTFRLKNPLYTMDSTLVHLCLSIFPWAKYRERKGALKMHTLLDHNGYLPSFVTVTDGNCHDITIVKDPRFPALPPDSIITIDRAYINLQWFYSLTIRKVFFVTRAKQNIHYSVTGQQEVPKNKGIRSDQTITLTGFYSAQRYPLPLRLIRYYDQETHEEFEFLTNNFILAASTIAALYKARWQIEIFFRWIKQNLKIKTFLGASENAVLTQIWIAMIYFLLLSFLKFQTKYAYSLHEFAQIIKEILLETVSLFEILRLKSVRGSAIMKNQQLSFL